MPAIAERPIQFTAQSPASGALVLPLGSETELAQRGAMLDGSALEAVARALSAAEFRYRAGSTLALRGIGPYSLILIVGTAGDGVEAVRMQNIGGIAARETARENAPVTIAAAGLGSGGEAAMQIGVGARLGGYRFDRYRSPDPENPRPPGRDAPLSVMTEHADQARAAWDGRGDSLARAVVFTRDLITEPANIIYPESFVERTREAFRGLGGVTIEALDVPAMQRLGMGGILSVGQGSARPPRMLIVQYRGQNAPARPIVLAGKGITFDSGGTSIKPSENMWRQKGDMAGAAAVVGAVLALARSGASVNVVAIAALAENMPGGGAARPGDVVRIHNGRTIERLNTDAEGRIVLADAVSYGERRFQPAAIVDVATLTGSIVTALGPDYAGLFTRNDGLAAQLTAAGEATGEPLWRMPLIGRYREATESPIADIRDIGEGAPGAGVGASVIGSFVTGATPWAHIDIAGTSWRSAALPTAPAGASGVTVRLLERFVRDFRPPQPAADGN
ncbi:MAG: leucyl aminopeptidase [Sphingomonas sp.]